MKRHWIHKFSWDERANASVQFVLAFPVIMLLFFVAFEAGVLSIRQVAMDRAMNDVMRSLRLSSSELPTQAEVNAMVCESAILIPDCANAVSVEVAPVDTVAWNINTAAMSCVDRDDGFVPIQNYSAGDTNQMMMVRICAVFEPLFPQVGLGEQLKRVNETDYAIVTASIYVNEPI